MGSVDREQSVGPRVTASSGEQAVLSRVTARKFKEQVRSSAPYRTLYYKVHGHTVRDSNNPVGGRCSSFTPPAGFQAAPRNRKCEEQKRMTARISVLYSTLLVALCPRSF